MSDKVIDSVVETALELKRIAIESAKTDIMNELSPKISKLFEEKVNKASKKVLREQEDDSDDVSVSVDGDSGDEDGKAEVDLDDLAKEIEKDEGSNEEKKTTDEKVDDLAQKLDAVEDKVESVKDDVASLKGEEEKEHAEGGDKEKPKDDEEIKVEDDTADKEAGTSEEDLSLGEAIDITIRDNDVHIDVDSESLSGAYSEPDTDDYVDIEDDAIPSEESYSDEDEDIEEMKEHRAMIRRRIREQSMEDKEGHIDPEDGDLVEIEDDCNWHEGEAPKKVSMLKAGTAEKLVPKLENRIRVLKGALKRASDIIVSERRSMGKVKDILAETKLLNEKLVFVNRIFAKYDLQKERKFKVLEAFDKAETSKESFTVYKTILEHFDGKKTTVKEATKKSTSLTEAVKKGVAKEAPKKEATGILTEAKTMEASRLLSLAGIDPNAE